MANTQHTPGPWAWQKMGEYRMLVAQHGDREIIIGSLPREKRNIITFPAMNDHGRLEPVDPEFPNAKLIAAAPDLFEALKNLMSYVNRSVISETQVPEYVAASQAIKKVIRNV